MGLMPWLVTHPHPNLPLEGEGARTVPVECLPVYFQRHRSFQIYVKKLLSTCLDRVIHTNHCVEQSDNIGKKQGVDTVTLVE